MTAVVIVAIVMVASIIRAAVRGPRQHNSVGAVDPQTRLENDRLRDEVSQLKARINVLERITVDKENRLAEEIESLRDR